MFGLFATLNPGLSGGYHKGILGMMREIGAWPLCIIVESLCNVLDLIIALCLFKGMHLSFRVSAVNSRMVQENK